MLAPEIEARYKLTNKILDELGINQISSSNKMKNLHHSYLKMNYLRENFYWMMNVKL